MYVYTYTMPTKTISIKEEAYNALKRLQLPEESFSDTILRITDKMGNLMFVYQNFPPLDKEEGQKEIEKILLKRKDFGRDRE